MDKHCFFLSREGRIAAVHSGPFGSKSILLIIDVNIYAYFVHLVHGFNQCVRLCRFR